ARGKEETQVGDHIHEHEEPDWKKIKSQSLTLLERSRDLRLILYLTVSKLCLEGLPGFYDGLALLRGVVERHWDHVYPQLDPEDDNDPMERMNIIGALSPPPSVMSDQDVMKFIPRLLNVPLCKSDDARLPHPSLKHFLVVSGEIQVPETETKDFPSRQLIDAAFEQTDIHVLQTTDQILHGCIEHIQVLDHLLVEHVGTAMAPSFNRLEQQLKQMQTKTGIYLERRGYGTNASLLKQTQDKIKTYFSGKEPSSDESLKETKKMNPSTVAPMNQELSGQITSNQDIHKALDMIISYYEQNEPSSPVPLLLKRAKRLVGKTFVDIIRNISPDAMPQVQMVRGEEEPADN
ncbi:MAG: type VI secretion system protein TssA, partial [Desulfobacteraceae bacterium]|nr:type VI secretion system protein TssA [Desulfobacteraceae bacterium]